MLIFAFGFKLSGWFIGTGPLTLIPVSTNAILHIN